MVVLANDITKESITLSKHLEGNLIIQLNYFHSVNVATSFLFSHASVSFILSLSLSLSLSHALSVSLSPTLSLSLSLSSFLSLSLTFLKNNDNEVAQKNQ